MKEIVNLTSRALVLGDGTILAARGTDGCAKRFENDSLSEADLRRLGDRIFVRDVEDRPKTEDGGRKAAVAGQQSPAAPKEKQ